jgi:NAD(P)-dependent dehydrogenase (short-subunit alcohol dehydrogenase family)
MAAKDAGTMTSEHRSATAERLGNPAKSPFDLTGDVVLVTGAGGGIGRAIVVALRDAGAAVVATDQASVDGILPHDVTLASDWARVAEIVGERYGRLNALVNNAGISITLPIADTSLNIWRRVQAINVEGILLGLHATLPLLREGGRGRKGGASVVNFSSVAGLRGAAYCAAYCASKASIAMFSKCAAIEYASLGYDIRVNSIHPGAIDTAMIHDIMSGYETLGVVPSAEIARKATEARHPLGRLGEPGEIAQSVVYLCSTASSFTTGSELVVDGGFTSL